MGWKSVSLQRSRARSQRFTTSMRPHVSGDRGRRSDLRVSALRNDSDHRLAVVAKLGGTVCVQDMDRTYLNVFTLVEPQSSRPTGPLLSVSSPLGRALLGTRAGDLVEIVGRSGTRRLLVKAILPRRPRPA
jgi:transcription elongation GreA/GreB family factor